jgi:hypothetical protein
MPSTVDRSDARPHSPGRIRPRSPRRTGARAAAALASGALALALALAGCSGSGGSNTSSSSAGAGGAGSYADSGAVISALQDAGQTCTPVSGSGGTAITAPGLRSISACSLGSSAGGTVTASVFDNHADAEAYAEMLTQAQSSGLLIGSGSARAVLGRNWVVLVDGAAAASRLGSALGGTVVGGSPSTG